jgi:hypothetical protein
VTVANVRRSTPGYEPPAHPASLLLVPFHLVSHSIYATPPPDVESFRNGLTLAMGRLVPGL